MTEERDGTESAPRHPLGVWIVTLFFFILPLAAITIFAP